ncbi:hypothetical protein BFJ68_g16112 [Fusarium oxysporum]|uniref:HTH CENPB-type domain-containing protein n=1 Tax=Fusarium oxysporum TaxID=5507 RepID=A0A420PGS9_FUSOX|nr:hypothetical protein BFJ68_g16112 [Fusarium oxysporum]
MASHSPYNEVPPNEPQEPSSLDCGESVSLFSESQAVTDRAIQTLKHVIRLDIAQLYLLVQSWRGTKANLPLAEPLVSRFAEATLEFWNLFDTDLDPDVWTTQQARFLLKNTQQSINMTATSTVGDFFAQVLGDNLRLEVLGIFLTAASRAAIDVPSFTPLYTSYQQKQALVKILTYTGDCCLESCLSLDCLNDLQLVFQYENLILHTQVDGDQSYRSWRRMGDATSSLFALGYHELSDDNTVDAPTFIMQLRKAAFARIYSADKMLAVFLGRPPRIAREYCAFSIPANDPDMWKEDMPAPQSGRDQTRSDPGIQAPQPSSAFHSESLNYIADTRCSAKFSSLKEDILKLSRRRHSPDVDHHHVEEAKYIMQRVEDLWITLPDHFKLSTSLRHSHADPFSNDFIVGLRLDYLHTLFLLHLASSKQMSQPGDALLAISGEILSHIIEVVMLRDRLVNSGTSLSWKVSLELEFLQSHGADVRQVAQYGLPAAGIISLALLNGSAHDAPGRQGRAKLVQDLSVLVAELKVGAIVRAGEPNYALFSRATRTMQSLLDSLTTWVPSESHQQTPDPNSIDLANGWDPNRFSISEWTEEDMRLALELRASGVSQSKAAATYGINRSTFQARLRGSTVPKEAHKPLQKLSEYQEKHLREWILIQDDLGCSVSHQQVRDFASKVARRNGFQEGVGKDWLQAFMRRYPDSKTLRGNKIDIDRFSGASAELIKAFFMLLMMPAIHKIKQKNRYNMDEVGMMEGIGMDGLVLWHAGKKSALLKQPGSRSWITILGCISTEGRVLPPSAIFKGKTVQQQHFPGNLSCLDSWNFTCSEKG